MPDSSDKVLDSTAITRRIADHAAALRYEDLPADIVALARQSLLDWLAVTLAGTREDLARILRDEAVEQGGRPVATIIGTSIKTGTQQAALVNGTTSHALDYDDAHFLAQVHCAATIVPGLLALAEERSASGRDFIAALVAGYEAIGAVSDFVGEKHYRLGFHATGTIGSFGAAAACANLRRLDSETTAVALGIAAAQAAGIRAMFGTMSKPLQAGKAAQNGLIAAALVARGFTSNPRALEAELGFAATHSPDFDPARAVVPPPRQWYLRYNVFKFHAACLLTHAPIECALDLRDRQGVTADAITAITLRIQPEARDVCDIVAPRTGLEAKFSLRQCLASVFAGFDTAALETFSDERVADPALIRLRERVEIDYRAEVPRGQAAIEITMHDGSRRSAEFDAGKAGDLIQQGGRLRNKFHRLATPVLGETGAARLAELAMDVDRLQSMRILTEAGSAHI